MKTNMNKTKHPNIDTTIVVTGGLGFIGSRFIKHVYDNTDWNIINIDKQTYAADKSRIPEYINDSERYEWMKCDIADDLLKYDGVSEAAYLVNFAAESHVDNSIKDGKPFLESNIMGVHALLATGLGMWNLKKFVQISTDEVYGDMADLRGTQYASESFNLKPSSYYSSSKAAADLLVLSAARTFNLPYLITRSCNNFGPGQDPEKFLPKIFKCIEEGTTVPVYGDGEHLREWIHVDENVAMIFNLLCDKDIINETVNIGTDQLMTNNAILKTLGTVLGKPVKQKFVEDRLGHDRAYRLDCSKLHHYFTKWGWNEIFNPLGTTLEEYFTYELERTKSTTDR